MLSEVPQCEITKEVLPLDGEPIRPLREQQAEDMIMGDDGEGFAERHLPGLRVGGGYVRHIPRE